MNYKNYTKVNRKISFFVFLVFSMIMILFGFSLYLVINFALSDMNFLTIKPAMIIFICIFISIIVASQGVSIYWINRITKPIEQISSVTEQIAQGNFDVNIDTKGFKNEMYYLGLNMNKMIEQIKSIEIMRSDFVSNVSHEFKAPLSAIQGYVTLLSSPSLSEEKREEYFELLSQSVSQMSGLVDNVLRLSKLESSTEVPKKLNYRLDEQLRCAVLIFEKSWSEKGLEPELDLPDCIYKGNEEMLWQLWINLIGNAVKFSKQNGKFGVKIEDDNDENIKVLIYDNGIGMNDEVKQHIFEKFYQGDTSHKEKGNGLGLALVKSICSLNNCKITVQSEYGKGSCFTVLLPKQ